MNDTASKSRENGDGPRRNADGNTLKLTATLPHVSASAVYGLDILEGHVPDAFPAYGGVEMIAGQMRTAWVDGSRVPLTDPAQYWDVAVRVSRHIPRHEVVAMLLALAGALEAERMPAPEEVADHQGRVLTVRPDLSLIVEPD